MTDALDRASLVLARTILDCLRPSQPPGDAKPGDPCGLLIPIGPDGRSTICDGTLDCWVDVYGPVPDCTCHRSPPCGACLEAPLACATCLGIIRDES